MISYTELGIYTFLFSSYFVFRIRSIDGHRGAIFLSSLVQTAGEAFAEPIAVCRFCPVPVRTNYRKYGYFF